MGGGANCERSNRKGIASYHAFDGLMELKVVTHYFVLCNLHISCFESNSLISFVCVVLCLQSSNYLSDSSSFSFQFKYSISYWPTCWS